MSEQSRAPPCRGSPSYAARFLKLAPPLDAMSPPASAPRVRPFTGAALRPHAMSPPRPADRLRLCLDAPASPLRRHDSAQVGASPRASTPENRSKSMPCAVRQQAREVLHYNITPPTPALAKGTKRELTGV